MPNWCENKVTIESGSASDMEKLLQFMGNTTTADSMEDAENKQMIMFDKILPMPTILVGLDSGSVSGVYEIRFNGQAERFFAAPWGDDAREAGAKDIPEFLAWIEEHKPEDWALAEKYKQAVDETGYKDWYDWHNAKWGTKWDLAAGDITIYEWDENMVSVTFDTAWRMPDGVHATIMKFIADENLDIDVSWFYYEPGCQFSGWL